DRALLERLAQRVENMPRELGELVEEQGTRVGKAHLSGPRWRPAADEREMRRGVVRRAERTRREERPRRIDQSRHAVHGAGDDRLARIERRQQTRKGAGEQRLAGAGRLDEAEA